MRLSQLLVMSVVLGVLISLSGLGARGHNFYLSSIVISGFIFGVGTLVNRAFEKFKRPG